MVAVMGMHKLVAGDGYTYLTRQVAAGDARLAAAEPLVAYYEASGTPPGRWAGSGLRGLGKDRHRVRSGDVVTEAGMAAVFRDGHDPATGEPLGRSYVGRRVPPVVGYDLTFTVPKSAAVLWALGDPRAQAAVLTAHHKAVAQALAFVEDSVVRTRVGAAGRRQIRTLGMVAAAFDHYDTRGGDPGLHTHVVLANKVQGPDKKWRSLDGTTVHAATVTVSELYDGLLADELHRRLGVTWSHRPRGIDRNDAFEIDGIEDRLLAEFSSRAERIHEAELDWAKDFTTAHGRGPNRLETIRARQHLTRATRPAKVVRPLAELLTQWANRARAVTGMEPHDLAARALAGDYQRGLRAGDVGPLVRDVFVAQMLEDAAEHRAVWSEWNLGSAAARVTKTLRMASPRQRHQLLNELTAAATARCVHLDDTRDPATRRIGESLFTSLELLGAEQVLLDAAERPVDLPHLRRQTRHLIGRETDPSRDLAGDQRDAVEAILTSRMALDVLVGPAGTGKTTTLATVAERWRAECGDVVGLAPSASAAHTLQAALRVPCHTTAKWLYETTGQGATERTARFLTGLRAERDVLAGADVDRAALDEARETWWTAQHEQEPWRLSEGDLLVVDEASLADTRTLAELVTQARAANAKVLLVGDQLQRGSVGAGGAFGMLARRGPTAELTSLWRFSRPWEARASLELRRGHTTVLDTYASHGAIDSGYREDMLDAALLAHSLATEAGQVTLLQAADTRTVRGLNAAAHAHAILAGNARATGGVGLHDGLEATVGDRVVTRHNDRRLRSPDGYVRNGALWHVTAIDPDGSLRVRPLSPTDGHDQRPDGAPVRLPASYVAEHVELGYAVTTARSQGLTVDATHTIAAPGMAREDLYVAMTRGRHANHVYVATDLIDDDCRAPAGRAPEPPTGRQVLERILATTHIEPTATETWIAFHPGRATPIPSVAQTRALAQAQRRSIAPPVALPSTPAHVIERSLW